MLGKKKVVCVIPARLQSTRFPRKMLCQLGGKPLLQWVWESAKQVSIFDEVGFAIDAHETQALIESFGGKWWMTSETCASGTDRLVELLQKKIVDADIWVNWQGDEPFIHNVMIEELLQECDAADVWTLKKKIHSLEEVHSPQFAKVVCDEKGNALYFSRSPIPFYRDSKDFETQAYYKHIGLYAFSKEALNKIAAMTPSPLEQAEQLEQLRFLHHHLRIRVHETQHEVLGIDLPEHLIKAESIIAYQAFAR